MNTTKYAAELLPDFVFGRAGSPKDAFGLERSCCEQRARAPDPRPRTHEPADRANAPAPAEKLASNDCPENPRESRPPRKPRPEDAERVNLRQALHVGQKTASEFRGQGVTLFWGQGVPCLPRMYRTT